MDKKPGKKQTTIRWNGGITQKDLQNVGKLIKDNNI